MIDFERELDKLLEESSEDIMDNFERVYIDLDQISEDYYNAAYDR